MSRRKHAIEAHFQSGLRLHGAGRLPEAEQVYRQTLAASPGHADSLHMLGVLALQSGQPQAAVAVIDQAIARSPTAALYHVNRANALLALGQLDAAEEGCRAALRYKRNCAEAFQVLGHVLSDLKRPEEAIAAYRDALRFNPNLPDLHNNLGLALRQAHRPDEASVALRQAVAQAPTDEQAQSNLAGVLKELGQVTEAAALYREALRRHPHDAMLHLNLGIVLLLAGSLVDGWQEYAWRFRAGAAQIPASPQPLWNGEPLAGRTLLVRAEQGMGDTIQFCRYLRLAASTGHVVFEVQPRLVRLLSQVAGAAHVVGVGDALPPFDLVCPLLNLPGLFSTPPDEMPYLAAAPDRVAKWRQRLSPNHRTIGIAWQGNPTSRAEHGRSVPLASFLPLARLPGVRLVSLQRQDGLDRLDRLPDGMRVETPADDFDAGPDAFLDTAAAMQCLDLIVTSDTAVAHLAGALGRPVWVALQHVPDWRWQLEREDSPWYPSMRLFRQTQRGDWEGVFARMAQAAAPLFA